MAMRASGLSNKVALGGILLDGVHDDFEADAADNLLDQALVVHLGAHDRAAHQQRTDAGFDCIPEHKPVSKKITATAAEHAQGTAPALKAISE